MKNYPCHIVFLIASTVYSNFLIDATAVPEPFTGGNPPNSPSQARLRVYSPLSGLLPVALLFMM